MLNEQDIPDEVWSSFQQLNSRAEGNKGALLTCLTCRFWKQDSNWEHNREWRSDQHLYWSPCSYSGRDPLDNDCLSGLNNQHQRSESTGLFKLLPLSAWFFILLFGAQICHCHVFLRCCAWLSIISLFVHRFYCTAQEKICCPCSQAYAKLLPNSHVNG